MLPKFFNKHVDPNVVFNQVYGLDYIKKILADAMSTEEGVAVLLHGPPASAKTLLLESIARFYNFSGGVPFALDERATPVGVAELFTEKYKAYVFDEIDKAKRGVLRIFNEAVEMRRVTFLKHEHRIVLKLDEKTKFVVGCNNIAELKKKVPELMTRFLEIPVPAMSLTYFKEILAMIMTKRGYTREQSDFVAEHAWRKGLQDIRKLRELVKIYTASNPEQARQNMHHILKYIAYWSVNQRQQ